METLIIIALITIISMLLEKKKYTRPITHTNNKPKQDVYNHTLYKMDIDELFHEYNKNKFNPPLDSLVRWAHEKGEITSGKFSFNSLSEIDPKIILRIAINIGHKRDKDNRNQLKIESKKHSANI